MISFRYHVVSLLGVLLALAAGIVLGGGPLQSSVAADSAPDHEAVQTAQARVQAAEKELAEADAFVTAGAARLVGGVLQGRSVTLLGLPGADSDVLTEMAGSVESAGGSVAAQLTLGDELLDVSNRQLVTTLAAQLQESAATNVTIPAGAGGYERMGLLLAHALTTRHDAGRPVTEAGKSILAGVRTAAMVMGDEPARRGSLAVLLTGEPTGSDDDRQGAAAILSSLAGALDRSSDGAVVAGPAGDDGLVAALRSAAVTTAPVSTVEGLGRPAGVPVTVLALAAEASGAKGHYGSTSAPDGLLPPVVGR